MDRRGEPVRLEQLLEVFGSYVWPLLVGAFLYLHRMGRRNERELSDLRVYVAKNYNNKEELKNLFNNLQQHFDTRIEDVKQLIIKKGRWSTSSCRICPSNWESSGAGGKAAGERPRHVPCAFPQVVSVPRR